MGLPEIAAFAVLGAGILTQGVTVGAACLTKGRKHASVIQGTPSVTVLRPVCGIENNLEETLRTTFTYSYRGPVQIIFCCEKPDDPVVPLVDRLIGEYPRIDATLLIGDEKVSGNPKLNNLVKGWNATTGEYVLMADSNVLLPVDYIERLFARWTKDTGLVTSPPAGIRADNFMGTLECGFLNTYQDRFQMASDVFGNGFAQGKMLFWKSEVLRNGGGLAFLGQDMAEDVASTKLVRKEGLHVRLLDELLPQPIGSRMFPEVWKRQVRWAKVRKMGFPALFAAEILTGIAMPYIALVALVALGGVPAIWLALLPILWFGGEWLLARRMGWPAGPRDLAAWVLRDALLPAIWLAAWFGKGFEWRGNAMHARDVTAR